MKEPFVHRPIDMYIITHGSTSKEKEEGGTDFKKKREEALDEGLGILS